MLTAWKFIVLSRYFHGPLQQGWKFSVTYEFILTVEDRGKLYPTGSLYIYRNKSEFAQEAAAEAEPKTWLDSTVLCLGVRQSPFNGVIPTLLNEVIPHSSVIPPATISSVGWSMELIMLML